MEKNEFEKLKDQELLSIEIKIAEIVDWINQQDDIDAPLEKIHVTCTNLDCPERTGGKCKHQPKEKEDIYQNDKEIWESYQEDKDTKDVTLPEHDLNQLEWWAFKYLRSTGIEPKEAFDIIYEARYLLNPR